MINLQKHVIILILAILFSVITGLFFGGKLGIGYQSYVDARFNLIQVLDFGESINPATERGKKRIELLLVAYFTEVQNSNSYIRRFALREMPESPISSYRKKAIEIDKLARSGLYSTPWSSLENLADFLRTHKL